MRQPLRSIALALLGRRSVRSVASPVAESLVGIGSRLRAGVAQSNSCWVEDPGVETEMPIRLEFLGPSGVGKSTLGAALLADETFAARIRPFGGLLPSRGISVCLKCQGAGGWGTSTHILDREYAALLDLKARAVCERGMSALDITKLLRWLMGNLEEDVLLTRHGATGVVLREDGLLHNFGSEILRRLEEEVPLHPLLTRRLVVQLKAPAEIIAERAIERQNRGEERPQYTGRTSSCVVLDIAAVSDRIDRLVARLCDLGVPLLTIDASSTPSDGVEAIRAFVPPALRRLDPADPSR